MSLNSLADTCFHSLHLDGMYIYSQFLGGYLSTSRVLRRVCRYSQFLGGYLLKAW